MAARDPGGEWIVIPNFDVYQHYKKRDPVWLRDYVRQLWHPDWLGLTLAQRGLLWTARLAYAHHNGQLRRGELWTYVPEEPGVTRGVTRVKRSRYANRLEQAGLMGFCASRPLSLKYIDVDARAGVNGRPEACADCGVGAGLHAADCPTVLLELRFDT